MDRRTRGVVIAAFIAQALAIGATIGSFSLFMRPVGEAFEASTLEMSSGVALITLTLAVCGLPIGMWLDRGSPRRIMFTGCAILTTGLMLASHAQSLWVLGVLCVFTGTGIPMLGPLTTAAVVGKAADEQRGRALGIANLGAPVGGVAFALTAGFVLDAWDWRVTLRCFAGIIACLGPAAIALGIPKDLGAQAGASQDAVPEGEVWTPKRLLTSPAFRLIALILGIGMGAAAGWSAHIAPFLTDLGASTRYAGLLVGGTQAAMGIGTVALGAMADRHSGTAILVGAFLVQFTCFALLLGGFGLPVSSLALVVSGAAAGGFLPVLGHLLAERFGTASLGRAMGLASIALLPFGFGLPMVAGALRDASGDYATTLMLCGALVLVGIGAVAGLIRQARDDAAD